MLGHLLPLTQHCRRREPTDEASNLHGLSAFGIKLQLHIQPRLRTRARLPVVARLWDWPGHCKLPECLACERILNVCSARFLRLGNSEMGLRTEDRAGAHTLFSRTGLVPSTGPQQSRFVELGVVPSLQQCLRLRPCWHGVLAKHGQG